MFNRYSVSFAALALSVVLGMDYITQAQALGRGPGEFSVSAYVDSITGRFFDARATRALAARQAVSAKTHLPGAQDGWERRDHIPEMRADLDTLSFAKQMQYKKQHKEALKLARDTAFEYLRGDQVVRLSARFEPAADAEGISGLAAAMVSGNLNLTDNIGYAYVQGVPYFVTDPQQASDETRIHAAIGTGLELTAWASANVPAEDLRALLEAVDYDALNAMLSTPQEGIGSAAPRLDPAGEQMMLTLATARQNGMERAEINALEAQLKAGVDQINATSGGAAFGTGTGQAGGAAMQGGTLRSGADASSADKARDPGVEIKRTQMQGKGCLTNRTGLCAVAQ